MPKAENGLKTCTRCGVTYSTDNFNRKFSNLDGLDFWCKNCVREYNKLRAEKRRIGHKEKRKSEKGHDTIYCMRSRYKKLGLPIPEKYALSDKSKSHTEVLEHRRERNRKYKLEHREEIREKAKTYRQSENGKLTMIRGEQRRRNLSANVLNDFSDDDFYFLLEFQDNRCACCGVHFSDLVVPCRDHIIPLSKGGDFTLKNVQLLCRSCNSVKHDKAVQYRPLIDTELYAEVI